MNDIQNNEVPERPGLCYISVVAFILSILICFIPSPPKDLIYLNIFALLIAIAALIRIKLTNAKLRGKGLAISAIVISLICTLFLFAAWFARTRPFQLM